MDFADLKHKSIKELQELLAEKRQELHELKFKVGEKQLKNVRAIKKTRLAVAQVLTLLKLKKEDQVKKDN